MTFKTNSPADAQTQFRLDERLAADTLDVARLALSGVRLMNDARFPWLVLVPQRAGMREITDLTGQDQTLLFDEIRLVMGVMQREFGPDKLNIGAIGNIVSQLHIHIVGRYRSDSVWPKPVWGQGTALPYDADARLARVTRLRDALQQD